MRSLLERWECFDPVLVADTKTSVVSRVRRGPGTAIVRALKPRGAAEGLPIDDYLAWRDGHGAVRLLAREGTTLLLEDAGSVTLREVLDEVGDDEATAILAEVVRSLHRSLPSAPPQSLRALDGWFSSLFLVADRDPRLRGPADLARALLADARTPVALHGDVHHENVLRGPRGWLAIDPNGLLGDPRFDVANVFCNPLDRDDLRLDPQRIRARAAILAPAVAATPEDVLRWTVAYAGLSAAWHLEDGNHDEAAGTLRVGEAVRAVLDG